MFLKFDKVLIFTFNVHFRGYNPLYEARNRNAWNKLTAGIKLNISRLFVILNSFYLFGVLMSFQLNESMGSISLQYISVIEYEKLCKHFL